jgi:hypothetical protein
LRAKRAAAAGAEKGAAIEALLAGGHVADLVQAGFVALLLGRLDRRNELLVRGNAARDRQRAVGVRVEVTLAYPHGGAPGDGMKGMSCR